MAGIIDPGKYFDTTSLKKKLKDTYKDLTDVNNKLNDLINVTKKSNESIKTQAATQSNTNKAIKQYNVSAKELTSLEKERIKLQNQLQSTMSKALTINEKTNKSLQAGKAAIQQRNQALRNQAKIERLNTEEGQKLNKTLQAQRQELRKLEGRGGGLVSSLKSMATGFLGVTALIYGAIKAIKGAVSISVNFEKQMDKVAAVTGATSEEIRMLSDDAKRLGGTTTQTATQVGQLQEEFAKLGFTTDEILNATGATIALAEASGSDLSQAAVVAASTLRGFRLETTETQRVVDVMAKSFSSSSLDINKFQTAMATVAPAAKASGVEIEQATALLGTLTDAGLDASTAGTSLRNIFLENAKSGRTFEQSLQLINDSTNKNATALELFGKRGAVAGLVLADNTLKTSELADKLDNAAGSAQEMADIMRDNLAGDVTILKSAWEGFILSVEDGQGIFTLSARKIVQALTWLVINMGKFKEQFVNGFNDISERSAIFRASLSVLGNAIKINFNVMKNGILLTIEPFILLGKAVKALITRDFEALRTTIPDSFNRIKSRVIDVKDTVVEAGTNIKNAFTGKTIDKFKLGAKDAADTMVDFNKIASFTTDRINDIGKAEIDLEKERKKAEEERRKRVKQQLSDIEMNTNQELLAQKKLLFEKKISEEEFAANILDIQVKSMMDQLDISELTAEQKLDIENKLLDTQIDIEKNKTEKLKEEEEKRTEKIKEEEEKRKEYAKQRQQALVDIGNSLFEFNSTLYERELTRIDEVEANKLALVGDNEQAQEQIKAQAEAKRKQVQRKQAISDKAQALFNAGINTARAVTAALALGPPQGIILGVLMGVLGAIQIATIAAKPIPKFAKGTGKDGLGRGMVAEFGERGREIIMEPNSMPYIAENPTIDYLPKGTKIYSNPDTEKILTKGGITPDHFNELIKEVRNNKPTIINKNTTITERGFEHEIRKGNTRIRLMNKYLGR